MVAFSFCIILFFTSCRTITKTIEIPVEVVKKEYVHNIKIDSIYITDSIDRFIRGDTFYLTKKHIEYKYINKIDTICKVDTIPKIVKVTEVKKIKVNHIKWYQKTFMWLGVIMTLLLAGIITYKIKLK